MNTHITLTKQAQKGFAKAPQQVQNKLLKWMRDVEAKGLAVVSVQPAYHDEPLTGQRLGQRSIRFNLQWRAIYTLQSNDTLLITLLEVTPHDYRTR